MKRKSDQSKDDNRGETNNERKSKKLDDESSNVSPSVELAVEVASTINSGNEQEGSSSGAIRKKKGRTSYVWNNFSIRLGSDQKTEYAHCNHCPSKYKLSDKANGGTGNLNVHLKTKHPDKIPQNLMQIEQKFVSRFSHTIDVFGYDLNPEAVTISKETVKRDIMKKFGEKVELIKLKLAKVCGKFSITLDAWTSKNGLPFLAIRAHWINDHWEYETILLDFCHVIGKHGGLNMSKIFLDCLRRFDLPLSKILGVTLDNAYSNDTFISTLESHGIKVNTNFSSKENRIRCMPHVLNLSVQDILKSLKIPLSIEQDSHGDEDEEDDTDDDETCNESYSDEEIDDEDEATEDN
ncbi:putative AC transposase, partial [Pseudolycoriella hygida]